MDLQDAPDLSACSAGLHWQPIVCTTSDPSYLCAPIMAMSMLLIAAAHHLRLHCEMGGSAEHDICCCAGVVADRIWRRYPS